MRFERNLRLPPCASLPPFVLHANQTNVFEPEQNCRDWRNNLRARVDLLPSDAPITIMVHDKGYRDNSADMTLYGSAPCAWPARFGHQSAYRRPQLIVHFNWNAHSRYLLPNIAIADVYMAAAQHALALRHFLAQLDQMLGPRRRSLLGQGAGARLVLLALSDLQTHPQTRVVMVDALIQRVETLSLLAKGKLDNVRFYNFINPAHAKRNRWISRILPRSGPADQLISLGLGQTQLNWTEFTLPKPDHRSKRQRFYTQSRNSMHYGFYPSAMDGLINRILHFVPCTQITPRHQRDMTQIQSCKLKAPPPSRPSKAG